MSFTETLPHQRSIKQVLLPLFVQAGESDYLRADSLGFWRDGEDRFWLPRFRFQRTTVEKRRIKVGIFAGIHGDEEFPVLGVADFLRAIESQPEIGKEYELYIYPVCNPSGFTDNTREARSGKDLNREFWKGSKEPEVQLLEAEIRARQFDGIIQLHSDDTSDGVYGFVRGATLTEYLLKPALASAERALPLNRGEVIDGFHAVEGIIRSGYGGILSAPPGTHPEPFEIVLETPQHAPGELQRQAFVLALTAILEEYRRVISFAADI